MRRDVGELLELRVRATERVRPLPKRLLGGGALCHLAAELRVHRLHLPLLVLEVVEDVQDRALRRLEPLLLAAEVLEDVEEGAVHHALPRLLLAAVVEDVQDRALRVLEPPLLVPEVVEDVQHRLLRVDLPDALPGEVLEDVEDGAVRVGQGEVEPRPIGGRQRHQRESLSGGTILRSSSISFFSSIILSSRPTVSLWKRSSSARRSSSRGALLGHLRLGLLLRGDVARGGEHAEHVAAHVLVDRGVVEHVGEPPVPVADGERVVGDEPLGEHLLVALARLLRLGEVVGEVGADRASRAARR